MLLHSFEELLTVGENGEGGSLQLQALMLISGLFGSLLAAKWWMVHKDMILPIVHTALMLTSVWNWERSLNPKFTSSMLS